MKKSDLNKNRHKKYVDLTKSANNIEVFYKKIQSLKNLFWLKNKQVIQILDGSANFSTEGLCNNYQEFLS